MAKYFSKKTDIHKPEIDLHLVQKFFDDRAKKVDKLGYKSTVIYQDNNLELVEQRDMAEKQKLLPQLLLKETDRCLDLGCGTGRWADSIVPAVSYYHGVDLSNDLLEIARNRFKDVNNAFFTEMKCQELSFSKLLVPEKFNKVLCFGLIMYLNDDDVRNLMTGIIDCMKDECFLLLREPIGINERLTIKEHFSDDMGQYYNAIYRTAEELIDICSSILSPYGISLVDSGAVFGDSSLNNRQETKQYWFTFRKHT